MKNISLLLLLSVVFVVPAKTQGTRKIEKEIKCKILENDKKAINSYETNYTTTFSIFGEIVNFKLSVTVNNESGEVGQILLYKVDDLACLYTSTIANQEGEESSTPYTSDIEEEDDGSIISTNSQWNRAISIVKMNNGYYEVKKLVKPLDGNLQITDYIY